MALNLQLNPRDYALFRPLLPATILLCPPGFGVLLDQVSLISSHLFFPVFANHLSLAWPTEWSGGLHRPHIPSGSGGGLWCAAAELRLSQFLPNQASGGR